MGIICPPRARSPDTRRRRRRGRGERDRGGQFKNNPLHVRWSAVSVADSAILSRATGPRPREPDDVGGGGGRERTRSACCRPMSLVLCDAVCVARDGAATARTRRRRRRGRAGADPERAKKQPRYNFLGYINFPKIPTRRGPNRELPTT